MSNLHPRDSFRVERQTTLDGHTVSVTAIAYTQECLKKLILELQGVRAILPKTVDEVNDE